jgi:hypothetical protein
MNILWETVKATAGIVGQAAVETGMKGKIQAELLLISNEIDHRKRTFGEELYGFVVRAIRLIRKSDTVFLSDSYAVIGTIIENTGFLCRE